MLEQDYCVMADPKKEFLALPTSDDHRHMKSGGEKSNGGERYVWMGSDWPKQVNRGLIYCDDKRGRHGWRDSQLDRPKMDIGDRNSR